MSDQMEAVWHGATWRTIPPPALLPRPVPSRDSLYKRSLIDVLTFWWQPRATIRARAGMDGSRCADYLRRLIADGRVEMQIVKRGIGSGSGRAQHFYRKVARTAQTETV